MSPTPLDAAIAPAAGAPDKGLQRNALGLGRIVALGLAAVAPAYSLAVTLGYVVGVVGVQTPAAFLLGFVPILFTVFAFRDLNPQAPMHVLVVPREHYPNAAALAAGDPQASAELLSTAAAVAAAEGHDDYRLVFNTGPSSGQSVFHAHLHLLAGRPMTWPPG